MNQISPYFRKIITTFLLVIIVSSAVLTPIHSATALTPIDDIAGFATGGKPVADWWVRVTSAISAPADAISAAVATKLGIKETITKPLAKILEAIIVQAITMQIVGWIQGGSPNFISNLDQSARQVANEAGGEFLNNLAGVNLCGNLSAFLRVSLRTSGLRARLACTVTDIVENVSDFYQNFAYGGWPAFARIAFQPQNNPYGAYLIALDSKLAFESERQRNFYFKQQTGQGFLGVQVPVKKDCVLISDQNAKVFKDMQAQGPSSKKGSIRQGIEEETLDAGEEGLYTRQKLCTTEYETKTPGKLVSDMLSNAMSAPLNLITNTDEIIGAAVLTITNALLQKLVTSTFSLLDSGSRGSYGDGGFDGGLVAIPVIDLNPTQVGTSAYQMIDENLLKVGQMLKIVDDVIIKTRQDITSVRATGGGGAVSPELQSTLANALDQKNALLSTQLQVLLLKDSLLNSRDIGSFTTQIQEIQYLTLKVNDMAQRFSGFGINPSGGSTPIFISAQAFGNIKQDTLAVLAGSRQDLTSEITILGGSATEIDRISTSTAANLDSVITITVRQTDIPAIVGVSIRAGDMYATSTQNALVIKRKSATLQLNLLQIELGKIAEAQADLQNAVTQTAVQAAVEDATKEIISANQIITQTETLLKDIDALLATITILPPRETGL
ncbi:MAG: hypothetical protein G01um101433_839 [Parcubacteria group bacterium Gr01-1014_33]|nr:MAG: hypothetical protein G01um101433_839 [Parcubacteria group bacterium Gr01-1014_33]